MKFATQPATEGELEQVLALTKQEGWGFDLEDLELLRDLDPEGFIVALEAGRVIGAATAVSYGSIGWIGNVVVGKEARKQGVGTALSQACVQYLHSIGRAAGLFSYAHSEQMYVKLGFRRIRKYGVYRSVAGARPARPNDWLERAHLQKQVKVAAASERIGEVCEYDEMQWGDDRSRLLQAWAKRYAHLAVAAVEPTLRGEDRIVGYAFARENSWGAEIGPMVSSSAAAADAMLSSLLERLKGRPVEASSPMWKPEVAKVVERHLDLQVEIAEMYHPPTTTPVRAECVYLAASQDKG